ncbi:MAG: hypothetical protein J6X85_08500 [Ruminococcus sp.]|nr:hypothetical protein [Ruminococcus sp.]
MMRKTNCTLMAGHIISALGSLFQPAWEISVDELLSKIESREELEFYYKWLCTTYTARGYIA